MLITHPKVKRIVAQSEKRIKKLTGNESVLLMVIKEPTVKVTFEQVEQVVCEVCAVPISLVYTKTRKKEVVTARHLISYYAKICCGMTLVAIGERIGGKDHTTVINSIRVVIGLAQSGDEIIVSNLNKITAGIEGMSSVADNLKK